MESLKNMLLVMTAQGNLREDGLGEEGKLWSLTWEKLDKVLPDLKRDLFGKKETNEKVIEPIKEHVAVTTDVVNDVIVEQDVEKNINDMVHEQPIMNMENIIVSTAE